MRKPSAETELRSVKRELRETTAVKEQYRQEAMVLRGQLNKAQAETGEWKRRFDMLLEKAKVVALPAPGLSGPSCGCGEPNAPGVQHRAGAPCFVLPTGLKP